MGPIGVQEMIFIFVLALLLFGPKKLPELGRLVGKGLHEFKKAKNELKTTFESHMQELERETRLTESSKTPASYTAPAVNAQYSSATYPYPYDEYGRESVTEGTAVASPETTQAALAAPETHVSETAEPGVQGSNGHHAPAMPVTGTVPRSHAMQNGDALNAPAEENHPA